MPSIIGLGTVWEICYIVRMGVGNETFGVAFLVFFVALVLLFIYLSLDVEILVSRISSSPLPGTTLQRKLSEGEVGCAEWSDERKPRLPRRHLLPDRPHLHLHHQPHLHSDSRLRPRR